MLDKTPAARTEAFLARFDQALQSGRIDEAVSLFAGESYWRDLVTFTWNIKTLEGRDEIRAMLARRLADVKPRGWAVAEGETATESGGVTEALIAFETEVARGYGMVRLKGDLIWTLLTTMAELKGHEEKTGFARPLGAKHGVNPGARTWKEEREHEAHAANSRIRP